MCTPVENPTTSSEIKSDINSSFYSTTNIRRKWWKECVAYQIYPRSFQDSNGDGIGDISGIIQRLDYIKDLGAELIWLCPIYKSPNDDNGYDISDYQDIMDVFGTIDDIDELIKQVHNRNMRIIFDLVLNHTSDEHPWFVESRSSRNSPKRDWYIWRDGKSGGRRPNNWESIFNGSAWEYDKETDQYYLHLFSRKMPDVNWECEELRQALYGMTRWWLDRGIDGFRIDAISHIKKKPGFPDLPNPKQLEFVSSFDYHMNVEGIQDHLMEFKRETYGNYDVVTVGEANGVGADQASDWVDEEHGKFNMIFQFEATNLWSKSLGTFDVLALKRILTRWQKSLEKSGWNALFLENHDKPRIVSTWGNDKEYLRDCATAFATFYMLMMGTPFIYQGQEIGMTNVRFPSITDYPDVAAKNYYNLQLAKGIDHDEIMSVIYVTGRDNARTPMHWDDSLNAGFSSAQQTWIGVNPNYVRINVAQQEKDEFSVLNFYKRLIRLRKENDIFIYGTYDLILSHHKQIFGYTRTSDTKRAYVLTNLTSRVAQFNLHQGLSSSQLILTNLIESIAEHQNVKSFKFHPYETRVYLIDYKRQDSEPYSRTHELKNVSKQSQNAQSVSSSGSLRKQQQSISTETDKSTEQPNKESVAEKRERQRSLVLNLDDVTTLSQSGNSNAVDDHARTNTSQILPQSSKPALKGHHTDSSSDEEPSVEKARYTTSDTEEDSIDMSARDIDYSVLFDDTIEDYSFSSVREKAKKQMVLDQQEKTE